jgi:Flp pilus assembly protein TadD
MSRSDISDEVQALNQSGESFFQVGELEKAKVEFIKALDVDPNDCRAVNNMGVVYWAGKDIRNALDKFTKAYEIDPYHRQVNRNLLEVLTKLDLREEAEIVCKTYMERYPEDSEIAQIIKSENE